VHFSSQNEAKIDRYPWFGSKTSGLKWLSSDLSVLRLSQPEWLRAARTHIWRALASGIRKDLGKYLIKSNSKTKPT
jgi:hypothetical protein